MPGDNNRQAKPSTAAARHISAPCTHTAQGMGESLPSPAHGTDQIMVGEDVAVGLGSVLRTAIGVMNAAFGRLPCSDSRATALQRHQLTPPLQVIASSQTLASRSSVRFTAGSRRTTEAPPRRSRRRAESRERPWRPE
jgi:hypothetical protein